MRININGIECGNKIMGKQEMEHVSLEHVKVIGTLYARECNYENMNILGTVDLDQCHVGEMKVYGKIAGEKCHIRAMDLFGQATLSHSEVTHIWVFGNLYGDDIKCKTLSIGEADMKDGTLFHRRVKQRLIKHIQGETLENFNVLELDGQAFTSIVNAGRLYDRNEIECKNFLSFGEVHAQEINADFCYINPFHESSMEEIHGSLVIIDPCFDETWANNIMLSNPLSLFYREQDQAKTKITCMEADEVFVDHVKVGTIRADKVHVGPHAQVERIEYRSDCQIHEDAIVKHKEKH